MVASWLKMPVRRVPSARRSCSLVVGLLSSTCGGGALAGAALAALAFVPGAAAAAAAPPVSVAGATAPSLQERRPGEGGAR